MFYNVSLIDLIRQKNKQLIVETRRRVNRDNSVVNRAYLKGGCPYSEAKRIREQGWKKKFIELTKPPHWHQVVLMNYDRISETQKSRSIVIQLSTSIVESPTSYHRSFGPYEPYVGSNTKEKIKKPSIDIIDKTTYTSALLEAGKIRSWTELIGSSNFAKILDNIIAKKVEVIGERFDISDRDHFAQVVSGNMFHSMSTSIEHTNAMVNGLLTLNSHFFQSSNNLQGITRDGEDYSVFFRMIYATNISILNMVASLGGEMPPQVACVLECKECTHWVQGAPNFDLRPFSNWVSSRVALASECVLTPTYQTNLPDYYFEIYVGQVISDSIDNNYELNHRTQDECASYLQSKANIHITE